MRKYDAEKLGKWTWILVRSEDWKQLVTQLHVDPASPAFSHLGYRQTFFDEALLVLKPKRELELMTKWNISFDQFLDFAVSHELGHAFCQESDEIKIDPVGDQTEKTDDRLRRLCEIGRYHRLWLACFSEMRHIHSVSNQKRVGIVLPLRVQQRFG